MKVQLVSKGTVRALEALVDATGLSIGEGKSPVLKYRGTTTAKWTYYLKGSCQEHTSRGGLVREILTRINDWMLDEGFVKIDILINARCSAGFPMFKIVE